MNDSHLPWWARKQKARTMRTTCDTWLTVSEGHRKSLPKGSFISPVKKEFLPYSHWAIESYEETIKVCGDTVVGFGLVPLEDVDWY